MWAGWGRDQNVRVLWKNIKMSSNILLLVSTEGKETENEIENILGNTCRKLPILMKGICIITQIQDATNPKKIHMKKVT